MKQEVNFYQVDETVTKSLAPLVMKVLSEKKRALIFCAEQKMISEIDNSLWSYGRSSFIPHVTIFDEHEFDLKNQPVLISNEEKNTNQAEFLIFTGKAPSDDFLKNFQRVFYFYEAQDLNLAKEFAAKFPPKTSYKKQDGKWISSTL